MSQLTTTATATTAAHALIEPGMPVVAMVSGGADSVALLRWLAGGGADPVLLSVLHVDHRLRGEASDADAGFVTALCERLGVPCAVVAVDVAALAAAERLNLEDAGRRARYAAAEAELDARCAAAGVDPARGRIATAHTFDDRAETLLMRLAQGTGAAGLLALPYRRERVVRPLLDCTRADVVAYLNGLGQDWREDATNADTTRLRARVRAELVPLLREINPRFDEALARTLSIVGDEDELLEGLASDAAQRVVTVERGAAGDAMLRIERSRAAALPRPVLRRLLRGALFAAFPESSRLEYEHLEAVCDGMAAGFFTRDLPGGLRVRSEYATLLISRSAAPDAPIAAVGLTVPGSTDLGDAGTIVVEVERSGSSDGTPTSIVIDADAVAGTMWAGPPEPGERMRPFGMDGTRKLQDVLTDAKVPARTRPVTPVVRDENGVVWVAGVRADERFRVTAATRRALRLTWIPVKREG